MEILSIEQVSHEIIQMPNPHVIIWYIGCYGLKNTGTQFYKNFLFSPIFSKHKDTTFWLVDLTAWNALKKHQSSIKKFSSACNVIETMHSQHIKCIKSSHIFMQMQKITDKDSITYLKKSLSRDFISNPSKHFECSNICLGSIFSNNCPVLSNWYNCDTNKFYSTLQYFEGYLIIDHVLSLIMKKEANANIQIVFALPNDEFKYYKDTQNSFQKDIQYLISKNYPSLGLYNISINIKFLSFQYGSKIEDRPYNAPGAVLKKSELSWNDIIDPLTINFSILG
ncbi:MAG: hypothetical protein QRY72_03310 [Candidatus Rhabdochlamydia sp.]